ncbi:hypothetical protein KA012_02270 [Candidatus Woesebacteria bacterium]|nr:hypothetical protein [Candidatus Woesebacteria bacterium]
MKIITNLLIGIGSIGIAAALCYAVYVEMPQFRADSARHDCAQDYHMEYLDQTTNTTIIKPIDDLYLLCLQQKGL